MDIFCRFYKNKTVIIKTMHPTTEFYIFISFNFHSNWTFIAPNVPLSKGALRSNRTKTVKLFLHSSAFLCVKIHAKLLFYLLSKLVSQPISCILVKYVINFDLFQQSSAK